MLPTACFSDPQPAVSFPYWIMPVAIPAQYFVTKATVIGLSALAGVLCFDLRGLGNLRPRWPDALVAVFCLAPLLPACAGHIAFFQAVRDISYLLLAWGVPYVLGRLYFPDLASLRILSSAFLIVGVAYLPLCLLEGIFGPFIYTLAYGFQPYREDGMQRYFGYRPIGFFEDGNQLGMVLAGAAIVAIWRFRSNDLPKFKGLPGWLVPVALALAAIAAQSVGAVLLLMAGLVILELTSRFRSKLLIGLILLAILSFFTLRMANVFSAHHIGRDTAVGRFAAQFLQSAGRSSLGWRMVVDERHIKTALAHVFTGNGEWNWWRDGNERPWGLWLLILGMYGVTALAAVYALLTLPLALLPRQLPARCWKSEHPSAAALAMLMAMTGVDSLLNGALFLPVLLATSALLGAGLPQRGRVRNYLV